MKTVLTLLFRFRQGMHADETALRFPPLVSPAASIPSGVLGSFFGRIGRGGIEGYTKPSISGMLDDR